MRVPHIRQVEDVGAPQLTSRKCGCPTLGASLFLRLGWAGAPTSDQVEDVCAPQLTSRKCGCPTLGASLFLRLGWAGAPQLTSRRCGRPTLVLPPNRDPILTPHLATYKGWEGTDVHFPGKHLDRKPLAQAVWSSDLAGSWIVPMLADSVDLEFPAVNQSNKGPSAAADGPLLKQS